ncbi:MAG TPA: HEAT repeat domain-containing protein [Smithellaceae bacterium]|nr:HEAT repeat domain-containing protein [Smithellaceae bacterium]
MEIEPDTVNCPKCGYDLTHFDKLSFEEKLISALGHPIRENRMMAVETLGKLRSVKAVAVFADILKNESDYYLIREIILALKKIDCPESRKMINELKTHRSNLVKNMIETLNKP